MFIPSKKSRHFERIVTISTILEINAYMYSIIVCTYQVNDEVFQSIFQFLCVFRTNMTLT